VSEKQAANASIRTKSAKLPVGALGLLYCVEAKALTTPFVVTAGVDQREVVETVWPERWLLPFGIAPLGSPRKLVRTSELKRLIPSLQNSAVNWNQLFFVTPTMVFTASKLSTEDWAALTTELID
jgi:hypothetical protein